MSDLNKQFDLVSTCYHEAGHAISGLLNFIKIENISVEPENNSGSTDYHSLINVNDHIDNKIQIERAKAEVLLLYAGLLAEKHNFINIFGNLSTPKSLKDGAEEDNSTALELIKKYNLAIPGKKRTFFKQKMIKICQSQIQNNWADIALVAQYLFLYKKMNYIDLQNLLLKKSKFKDFWKKQFKKINYIFDIKHNLDENQLKSIFLYLTA